MAEKNEVLPGFVGPYETRNRGTLVVDSTGLVVFCGQVDSCQSLARVLNSHAQCVEALRKITKQTDDPIAFDIAEAALKLAEGVEHG